MLKDQTQRKTRTLPFAESVGTPNYMMRTEDRSKHAGTLQVVAVLLDASCLVEAGELQLGNEVQSVIQKETTIPLIFLSLLFWISLPFSLQGISLLFECSSLLPRDFRGSIWRKKTLLFGWFSLLFPKEQGKEDQGLDS